MKGSQKWTLFSNYLLSNILVFLIPFLVLGFLMYDQAVIKVQEEIEESNLSKLRQIDELLTDQFKGLQNTAAQISLDRRLTPYMVREDGISAKEAIEELRKYRANSPVADEVLLHFNGDDYVYSSNGKSSLQTLASSYPAFVGMTAAELKQQLESLSPPYITSTQNSTLSTSSARKLSYTVPIPVNDPLAYGTVVFLIEESRLTRLMQTVLRDWKGSLYITSPAQGVIASSNNHTLLSDFDPGLLKAAPAGISALDWNSHPVSVARIESVKLGWYFYTLLPTRQFLEKMFETRIVLIYVLVLLLLAGALAATVLALKHYRPVRKLDEYVCTLWEPRQGTPDTSDAPHVNEWERIHRRIHAAVHSHNELVRHVDSCSPYVRDQLLLRLLDGTIREESELAEKLPWMEAWVKGSRFCVLRVSARQGRAGAKQDRPLGESSVLLGEFSFTYGSGCGIQLLAQGDTVMLAAITEDGIPKLREVREQLAGQLSLKVQEATGEAPVIGIGTCCGKITELNRSFVEASAALEYKLLNRQGQPIFFEDIHQLEETTNWYSPEEQTRLLQGIKQGDFTVAADALAAIIRSIERQEQALPIIRCMCFDLINGLVKTVFELKASERYAGQLKELAEFTDLRGLESGLTALITSLCQEIGEQKSLEQDNGRAALLEFIHSGYPSYDLSLELVAARFGLSVSYTSRLIKESIGVTFTDYVAQLRMERIKGELTTTDKPIKDIILTAGYLDVSSFTRKFKQQEGVTPGQFRKLHLGG